MMRYTDHILQHGITDSKGDFRIYNLCLDLSIKNAL